MRLGLAFRAFFRVLGNAAVAERVAAALQETGVAPGGPVSVPAPQVPPPAPKPARSEALTLLATLQREARFIDFILEPLEAFSDAQVGAVARDVHRDCGKVMERLFGIQAVVAAEEGSAIELPPGFDAGRHRLTGNIAGPPPFRGKLVHHGWEATRCDLPAWTGTPEAARVVAPAEVQVM
jgi:hypothetical protein